MTFAGLVSPPAPERHTPPRLERTPHPAMGSLIHFSATAERAYRHTLAEDVAKRPVRPRRRFFRR